MNKERLEKILKIREIRNSLNNLELDNIKKEILKKVLNNYEDMLTLDIERTNNDANFLEEMEINHDERVEVPVEKETLRYKSFSEVNDNLMVKELNNVDNIVNNISLPEGKKKIILEAIKEYCIFLEQLSLERQSNNQLYDEIFNSKIK